MASQPEPIKILAPHSFRQALSRRALFQVGGAAAGLAIVATACGSDSKATPATTAAPGGATTTAGTGTTAAPGTTTGGTGATTDGTAVAQASGDWSRVVNKSSGTLAMYTWGEYNEPAIVGDLAASTLGVQMKVDYYTSNEDLITKLSASSGSSGFDVVVPTGPYIPQMIQKGLLEKFDKSKLPNIVNLDPLYLKQAWDPTNDYSVCKDWGSTGYMWDTTQISKDIVTWQDFMDACMGEGSGNCSVLDTPANVCGMWLWANGYDWNTNDQAQLDACEKFLVDEFASHIKAFDSYPSTKMAEGAYAVSMFWNGDARQAYQRIADAGGEPKNFKWALGAPATELWMDNYCIPKGAPNPDAAHAWINWLMVPEISIRDLNYHGYHSGMKNIDKLIAELYPNMAHPDMIFFPDAQVKTMHTQIVGASQDRLVAILDKVKAKAGG